MFEPLSEDCARALDAASLRLGAWGAVRYRAEVDSTNDLAMALAAAGADEGTSVLADAQRQGRGRRGHDWFSPPESGVYLSIIVRPDMTHGLLPMVTIAAGVAMAAAVAAVSALPVELKWPNDLVIGRSWRKMGGVLSETVSVQGRIDAVVVGLGVNVRRSSYPAALADSATSIETELGRPVERAALVVELLAAMREMMALVHRDDRKGIAARWRQLAAPGLAGRSVRWNDGRGVQRGTATDIDDDGALLVMVERRMERVIAGDLTWEDAAR